MTAQILMLHIRVDDDVKDRATLAFNAMGLFVSNAVRQFLRRAVVSQAYPLELKVPNANAGCHARVAFHDGESQIKVCF